MFSRLSFLRRASRSIVRAAPRRNAHADVQKPPGSPKGVTDDFRPPWVYTLSRAGSYIVIPVVSLYCIFVYDWGDREHVFMPPRRWLARMKQSFFTLSPEEEKMLNAEIVVQRVQRLPPGTIWRPTEPPVTLKDPTPTPTSPEL